jgi:dTDP-glucose 4,6-dehydratase
MKILVTGAAGFIGSNLVHLLLEKRPQWSVHALDLLTYAGNLENLKAPLEAGRIQFHKLDISSAEDVAGLFRAHRFDIVFHLAAETHVDRSIFKAVDFVRTNVLGTQLLVNATLEQKGARFVHISTDEVYGSLGPTGRFVETTPLDPSSPYSASKAASDLMVQAAVKTHGLDAVMTRCTNNYGPYQFPEKLIPLFVTNALEDKSLPLYGDGMNVRSWLHVRDHCEALLLVAERGRSGEVYNIGGAEEAEVPNVEITKRILKILQKPESLIQHVADRPAHDRRYAIDYSKINTELGWAPQVPVAHGLEQTVQWYVDNRQWWQRIKSGEYMKFYQLNYASRGQTL